MAGRGNFDLSQFGGQGQGLNNFPFFRLPFINPAFSQAVQGIPFMNPDFTRGGTNPFINPAFSQAIQGIPLRSPTWQGGGGSPQVGGSSGGGLNQLTRNVANPTTTTGHFIPFNGPLPTFPNLPRITADQLRPLLSLKQPSYQSWGSPNLGGATYNPTASRTDMAARGLLPSPYSRLVSTPIRPDMAITQNR